MEFKSAAFGSGRVVEKVETGGFEYLLQFPPVVALTAKVATSYASQHHFLPL